MKRVQPGGALGLGSTRRAALALMASSLGCRPTTPFDQKVDLTFEHARGLPRLTSLSIWRDGRLVRQQHQHGLAGPEAPTNGKSVSKSLLGLLVGVALDKGAIASLDDALGRYLPRTFGPTTAFAHLTVRHLLTMTADLPMAAGPSYPALASSANWLEFLTTRGRVGVLGQHRYTTGDTHVLGIVLAYAVGSDLLTFAKQHFLGPLGIDDIQWPTDPQGYHRGGNDMFLCTRDLGRIGQMLLDGGVWQGRQILSREYVEAATRKQVDLQEDQDPKGGLRLDGYGYLWWTLELAGHRAYAAWGYGRQYLIVVPATRTVIVLTSQTEGTIPPEHHRQVVALIDPMLASALATLKPA